jgi:hypothetical protein
MLGEERPWIETPMAGTPVELPPPPDAKRDVVRWSIPRNGSIPAPTFDEIRASGPLVPPPEPRVPVPVQIWRALVASYRWAFRVERTGQLPLAPSPQFVERWYEDHPDRLPGALPAARPGTTRSKNRFGVLYLHAQGIVFIAMRQRSFVRVVLNAVLRWLVDEPVERILGLLVALFVRALARTGASVGFWEVWVVFLFTYALWLRIPQVALALLPEGWALAHGLRTYLDRARHNREERVGREVSDLLEQGLHLPQTVAISWVDLVEVEIEGKAWDLSLESRDRWTLTRESPDGDREAVTLVVPAWRVGRPRDGFRDARRAADRAATGAT